MKNYFVDNKKKSNYEYKLATVATYSNYRATLIFAGETTASAKQYIVDYWFSLRAGQKVIVRKIAGTYTIVSKLGT